MEYTKIRKVKSPERAHKEDAGIDFFIPKFTNDFLKAFQSHNFIMSEDVDLQKKEIFLGAHTSLIIPLGIIVKVPPFHGMIPINKSGNYFKRGISIFPCLIDPGYAGEVLLKIQNLTKSFIALPEDMKIVQFVLTRLYAGPIIEKSSFEELYPEMSKRGANGFGSTG